ncbi:hypothetical protein HK104_006007, partial [Borealophlyctis nickersoniae]
MKASSFLELDPPKVILPAPNNGPNRFAMSAESFFIALACVAFVGLILHAYNIFKAFKAHRRKRSWMTLGQLVTMVLGFITSFCGPCLYFYNARWDSGFATWTGYPRKFFKIFLILTFTLYLLLIQYRYKILVPYHRLRDRILCAITLVFGLGYLIIAIVEAADAFDAPRPLLLVYSVGYYVFVIYTLIVDNIICVHILRRLIKVKRNLRAA